MCDQKPRFVSCPPHFEPLFVGAEEALSGFFSGLDQRPEKGEIAVSGERYILARAATFSVQLREILEQEYGKLAAEKLAYSLGRAAGLKDAEFFIDRLKLERGPAALSAGPVHFAFVGWAYVDIFPESAPTTDENYFLIYDHPYSFEADSYIREGLKPTRPVCQMNAGYSSGWCQVAFGVDLVAKEISCRAAGHDKCIFVMGHPSRINEYVVEWKERYGIE
jgi:predicted hydrocarbon binding protein